jgi:hypothetical protein
MNFVVCITRSCIRGGLQAISGESGPYALTKSNVRRPPRDIVGEGFEEHEIFSAATEGYG